MSGEGQGIGPGPEDGAESEWKRFLLEAGWLAWGLGLLAASGSWVAFVAAIGTGPGSLDVEGATLFWNIAAVTIPLTIAAVIFFAVAYLGWLHSGFHLAVAALGALVAGATIGSWLGDQTGITVSEAVTYHGSSPPGMGATALEYLTAYYKLYGWFSFVGAIAIGWLFGKWAARVYERTQA